MTKTLGQILSDGTLVDNTTHRAHEGVFSAGLRREPIEIKQGRGAKGASAAWPLMQAAASLETEGAALVFRTQDEEYEHNTDDSFISLTGTEQDFTLTTGNLIGSVKSGSYSLRVSSRFGSDFVKYIIANADGFIELPNRGGTDGGDNDWLLVYFWLMKLKKAFRLGLPKNYEARTESLAGARGRLDPVDYFLNHERARYRCTYREHSYDNSTTRLIARTLQHLDGHAFLREAHSLNQPFQIATQGRRHALGKLLATPEIRNPYYADYNPVITLSKRILRTELSDVGEQSDTSALLFDVSMLFEYFVRKMLKRSGIVFHSKIDQSWKIPSGLPTGYKHRRLIPDLVFEIDGSTYVFDVKYKSFDFLYGVSREDLFQLHTYIGQLSNEHSIAGCGFIYPIRESRWITCGLDERQGIFSETIIQGGREMPFHIAFLKVPEHQLTMQNCGEGVTFQTRFQLNNRQFVHAFVDRITDCWNRRRSSDSMRAFHPSIALR